MRTASQQGALLGTPQFRTVDHQFCSQHCHELGVSEYQSLFYQYYIAIISHGIATVSPFFGTRPQRHTKTGLDVGIHGIPSRLLNSLVYANNMLIWMFMVVSLLYRHLTTGSFNITEKTKQKKHSAKDVSLQKSIKKNAHSKSPRCGPRASSSFHRTTPECLGQVYTLWCGHTSRQNLGENSPREPQPSKSKNDFPSLISGFTNGKQMKRTNNTCKKKHTWSK